MEVEMILSSAFEDIVSPHDLAVAIGVPHRGGKLRLYRDTVGKRAATKIVIQCDKPTASRLRHRFSTYSSRVYVHHGRLASLRFAGMRPVATGRHLPAKAISRQGAVAAASTARTEPPSFSNSDMVLSAPSSNSLCVEIALEMVDRDEAAAGLRVPGISELYQEFQRSASGTRDGVMMHVGARRRRRRAHANEEKMDSDTGRDYDGEGKLSDEDITRSEECGGCSSSETKRGSSTDDSDSFGWDGGRGVGHGETMPRRQRRRRRHRRHRSRAWREEEEDRKPTRKFLAQQRVAAHRRRWRQRRAMACTRSVADVASALFRISREYPDAPQPPGRTGIVTILTKMYTDGAAFTGNRQRDIETLDRLGVTRWSARIHPQLPFPRETTGASEIGRRSKKARKGWLRILWRVIALVRNIAGFGIFVQVYAAAAVERDRLRASPAAVSVEGSCTRGGKKGRGRGHRGRPPLPHLGASDEDNDDDDDDDFRPEVRPGAFPAPAHGRPPPTRSGVGRGTKADDAIAWNGRETVPDAARKGADAGAGTETEISDGHMENPEYSSCQLRWLFPGPGRGDDGRRAFDRYAICGGGIHGLVTLEAAAAIVRDAGKYVSMEHIWRWFCVRSVGRNGSEVAGSEPGAAPGRGRLLRFEDFVEMCDGLRDHMEGVSIMSDDGIQRQV